MPCYIRQRFKHFPKTVNRHFGGTNVALVYLFGTCIAIAQLFWQAKTRFVLELCRYTTGSTYIYPKKLHL